MHLTLTAMFMGVVTLFATARFTDSVRVEDKTDSIVITFAVSEPTVATVEVVDTTGKTVRHLASGLLGPRAPKPFLKNRLQQTIAWNKRDDAGRAVLGRFDVKVGLGLRATLDRFYLPAGYHLFRGYPVAAAADSVGNVYMVSGSYRGESQLAAFKNDGSYLRILNPYPGYHAEDKLKGFGRHQFSDGSKGPVIYQGTHGNILPAMHGSVRDDMAVIPGGGLALVGSGSCFYGNMAPFGRRVLRINMDGSCYKDTVLGPLLAGLKDPMHIAVSPSAEWVIAAGGTKAVCRAKLDTTGAVQPFITSGLLEARGVDFDNQSRIYVCDYADNKVKVFSADGQTLLDSLHVVRPEIIKVHRQTGAVYLLSLDTTKSYAQLIKISPLPAFDSVTAVNMAWSYKQYKPVLALHYQTSTPRLWVGPLEYGKGELTAVEDQAEGLKVLNVKAGALPSGTTGWANATNGPPGYLAVSPDEKTLYAGIVKWNKIDIASGTITTSKIAGREIAFAPDGSIYATSPQSYVDSNVWRYDRNENRINLPNGALSWVGPKQYCWGPEYGTRGFYITANHHFYFNHAYGNPRGTSFGIAGTDNNRISVFDSTLQLIDSMRVTAPPSAGGVQVAPDGSIYMAYGCRPKGITYPPYDAPNQMPSPLTQTPYSWSWSMSYMNYYLYYTGSLFKFKPTGGAIGEGGVAVSAVPNSSHADSVPTWQVCGWYNHAVQVQGAAWQYHGISLQPAMENMGDPTCKCFTPRFSLDAFGRVTMPDALRFSVAMIDDERNELLRFGSYGNMDQTGLQGNVPSPAIPLAYPMYVVQINHSIYVSDVGNGRIAKVLLSYDSWATASGEVHDAESRAELKNRGATESILSWPQPFNPSVRIAITAQPNIPVHLTIYTMSGKKVRGFGTLKNGYGLAETYWDGKGALGESLPTGIYIARAVIGSRTLSRQLLLVK